MLCPLFLGGTLFADKPATTPAAQSATVVQSKDGQPTYTLTLREQISELDPDSSRVQALLSLAEKYSQSDKMVRTDDLDTLREMGALKYNTQPAHMNKVSPETWKKSALSLADARFAHQLSGRLPVVATAANLTGNSRYSDYVIEQLEEVATWVPFERPGWSINNGRPTLPPEGDGAWLGTGWAIRMICDTVECMPDNSIPPELMAALKQRMEEEIVGLLDDYETKRTWYYDKEAVYSNQWIIPNEGLLRACLFVGKDKHPEAYELAVQNLLRSLNSQGEKGEFVEGMSYGTLAVDGIVSAARDAALHGDTRLIDHPFMQNFPVWLVEHEQPGGTCVNAFDCGSFGASSEMLATFVAMTGNPVAKWAFTGPLGKNYPTSLDGTLAAASTVTPVEAPLFEYYPIATRVNWRNSWDKDASGFWMRGGHPTDFHDHQDRGHLSYVVKGQPVLMEAGLFSYGIKDHPTHYRSVAGHNVLQVGNLPPEKLSDAALKGGAGQLRDPEGKTAPMTVHRLDKSGGEVSVDGSACYASVDTWERTATWDAEYLDVSDHVVLKEPDFITFRWHLAVPADTPYKTLENGIRVGNIDITYDANQPVKVWVETMPDNTIYRPKNERPGTHASVVIQTTEAVDGLDLESTISVSAETVSAMPSKDKVPSIAIPTGTPELIQMNYADLVANRKAYEDGVPAFVEAVDALKARADKELSKPLLTVTDPQKMVASSGDPHDFHTIGKYSWPNPNTEDGMPWIRQDGLINPDSTTDKYDMQRFRDLRSSVVELGQAWFYTEEEAYATKATDFLHTWFIDPSTRMNPNFNFGSSQPGVHEGMPIGIIFGADMIRMLDFVKLLPGSEAWTQENEDGLKQWFDEYTEWLVTSPFGKEEAQNKNNHGSWYTAQVAVYSLYAGNRERAETAMERAHTYFDDQISPEGIFVYENERNRSFSYSLYSLKSLVTLANCGKYLGMDLWNYESPNKPGSPAIKVACMYLLPYVIGEKPWPKQEIGNMRGVYGQALVIFLQAAEEYDSPELARASEIVREKLDQTVNLRLNNAQFIPESKSPTASNPTK
ncbi:alginate lyase family protein [Ruficoccus sp. ZRK36]|uniref:alginate lyase family protein n=1 Tax=Ruficoccus sp. ZRK36 TaxID=2866311 RepID=UPI001C72A72C|nr:alginate lyase family protein [Ruficoccus sp. ZRK36]QYY34513.1 alginate lyase family protein [Ruficoccus sp. ZRK36]